MATSRNKAPWFFNFLKEGFLLPSRNWRLFTAVCALILVSTTLLVLSSELAVKPLADETQLDIKAFNTTEPGIPDYANLLQGLTKEFLLSGPGYGLFLDVVRYAVQIVILFAAVSTYSGERRATTFSVLLGQAKAQIKGPLLTVAFGYVLQTVLVRVFLVVMTTLPIVLVAKQYFVALFVAVLLLLIPAGVCLMYFSFICSFSVVVAVAEPRCHGVAALVRAWRLAKKRQVALYLAVTTALGYAVSPVRTLARTSAGNSVALGFVLGFVYAILLALEQLFAACAMTALYYERREISDGKLGAAGSTKEAKA